MIGAGGSDGPSRSSGRTARLLLHQAITGVVRVTVTAVATAARILRRREEPQSQLCIESGRGGFDLIEVKELVRSAQEQFGADRIVTHVVENRRRYLRAAHSRIRSNLPRRYWVDPRSGAQRWLRAVLQSIGLAHLLAWYGVTPIVWLADVPVRRWRLQAEILSATTGVALIVMDPNHCDIPFAHRRFIGPMPPPFSVQTIIDLEQARQSASANEQPRIIFAGSLYEPRRSSLLRIQQDLRERGLNLEIHARELGAPRIPDEDYWALLTGADILLTTAAQATGPGIDATSTPHLVYRYTEALLAGAALVAPHISGSEHLYRPNVDYVAFADEATAVLAVQRLVGDVVFRRGVAASGHARAVQMVQEGYVWRQADSAATA